MVNKVREYEPQRVVMEVDKELLGKSKDKVEKEVGLGHLSYPKIFNYIMQKYIGEKNGFKRSS
jgi:hypothetical protein|tara:strand:+ start:736 stop:924 length:189 start_codon:yes stop_codon:yes gene_type:complete